MSSPLSRLQFFTCWSTAHCKQLPARLNWLRSERLPLKKKMCADNSGLPNGCPTGQQLNINKSSINGECVTISWTDCCQFWHMNVANRAKTQPEWNHWRKLLKHAPHSTSLKIFLEFWFFKWWIVQRCFHIVAPFVLSSETKPPRECDGAAGIR